MDSLIGPQRLNEFPSSRGGDTCVYGGYVWEYCPGHAIQNHWGWVAQHRLVGESMIGRPLRQGKDPDWAEVVHHKDENRTNNDPSNLQVMTQKQHRRHHGRIMADRLLAKITTEQVRDALVGRTIREAATHLGTTHMTLRRRWPDLVAPRKRKSPVKVSDPSWIELMKPFAENPQMTVKMTAREFGIWPLMVTKICKHHGIRWVADKAAGRTGRPKGSKNKTPKTKSS